MKKILGLCLAMLLIFGFAGCAFGFSAEAFELLDATPEAYAYAVKKGTNADVLLAINDVIDGLGEEKISELVAFFLLVAGGNTEETCPVEIPTVFSGSPLRVGTEASFAPFEFLQGTEVVGFDMAIMALTAQKMGRTLEIVAYNSFAGMEAGVGVDFDVIAAGYTKTEERQQRLDFSDTYYTSTQFVVTASGKNFDTLSSLAGQKIGVQTSTTGDFLITDEVSTGVLFETGAQVFNYQSFTVAYLDLQRGTIDAIVLDKLPAQMLIAESSEGIFYNTLIKEQRYLLYCNGLLNTLVIALGAIALGSALGLLIAIVNYYAKKLKKFTVLNKIFSTYVFVVRGTPVMLQLMIMWFVVLVFLKQQLVVAIITFGLNSAAYVSELLRGSLNSVDNGQFEAGHSLALPPRHVIGKVIVPQALKTSVPALFNEFISLIKETSVVGIIAIIDITNAASLIMSRTASAFAPLLVSAAIYLVLVAGLTLLLRAVERRLTSNEN